MKCSKPQSIVQERSDHRWTDIKPVSSWNVHRFDQWGPKKTTNNNSKPCQTSTITLLVVYRIALPSKPLEFPLEVVSRTTTLKWNSLPWLLHIPTLQKRLYITVKLFQIFYMISFSLHRVGWHINFLIKFVRLFDHLGRTLPLRG